jgi:hypothetical protein
MDESICIQSTWSNLNVVLKKKAQIGQVQYADYESQWIPEFDPLLPFLYKRRSFEHEREIRAIIDTASTSYPVGASSAADSSEEGIRIPVDLTKLIVTVFVSPKAPEWFFELVKQVVTRYRLKTPVKQSSLMAEPFY